MLIVYTVCEDEEQANTIARALIEKKAAACVNMFPVNSVFEWNGQVEQKKEVALFIKTKKNKFDEASDIIKGLHSYEIPAILSFDVSKVDEDYARWLYECVK